jgi:hypothetical protein
MRKIIFGLFIVLALVSCQREHSNPYDVLTESFTAPAPLQWCDGVPLYDPNSGYLVGVVMTFVYAEPFPKTMGITHILYESGSAVDSAGFVINCGTQVWQVGIYTSSQFPVGVYCLKLFFGGFPISGFPFQVVEIAGKRVFQGVMPTVPRTPDLEGRVMNIEF